MLQPRMDEAAAAADVLISGDSNGVMDGLDEAPGVEQLL